MDNIFSRAGDTMKNYKGIAETVLLLWIIVGLTLFFVPNPVSKVVGVGIQPNKTIERVELIKDKEGVPIAYRTTITEQQQKPTLMQSLLNLPRLWLLFMFAGIFFPPIAGVMAWVNRGLKTGLKQIVVGVEEARKLLPKESSDILDANLSKKMDTSVKTAVKKIKVKL